MKILLADSGSTKTEWTVLDNGSVAKSVFTEGINPNQADTATIAKMLKASDAKSLKPDQIYFYGSGCGNLGGKNVVRAALEEVFGTTKVEVESDLLGAARGLSRNERSIVAILGTGASSCLFDGEKIVEQRPSLGFILGDEGSGASLGKAFIRKLLYKEIPDEVSDAFYAEFQFDKDAIIRRVYREAYPNRFLAAFCEFISKHKTHASVNEVIRENFTALIKSQFSRYTDAKKTPIHFTGSVAYFFGEELVSLLNWNGYVAGKTEQSPMSGLIKYHTT
jgi:N-acetylglucosamine kinase-like BadF-type ATPase